MNAAPDFLDQIRRTIGKPGRKTGWFKAPPFSFPEPHWLVGSSASEDPVKNIFGAFHDIWKHGVVVWGLVVRANLMMYEEGPDDSPGNVIFSTVAPDSLALEWLPKLAERLWFLREQERPLAAWSQKETEWWEDLTNDMSFQKGVKLPPEWPSGGAGYQGSSIVFHRPHLPGGRIRSRILPLLVDPVSNYAQTIPRDIWPDGMSDWLLENFPLGSGDEEPEEAFESFDPADCLAETPVDREARETAYQQVFGPIISVFHEFTPGPMHIDVYRFEWGDPRHEHAYVTGGMGDVIQPDGGEFGRIELVFYSKRHDKRYPELLQNFSRYPWQTGASIGPWHTIPLGPYGEAVVGSSRFSALLFFPGVAKPETPIHFAPPISAAGIRYLTVVPITELELQLMFDQGIQALIELFDRTRFDLAFDPGRPSLA